ncbi:uncharacterized protein LTR77_000637 [Saxophila tyrrhenica]|uniref:Uncharacterized protein n=1 Tax=Saxophila tyrrhenica TaxID=1690608 RepID=A0AAV9PT27_9PEZI|nr:hypothetical protein LTR77_000637 [Saxophila tyrrhenica]
MGPKKRNKGGGEAKKRAEDEQPKNKDGESSGTDEHSSSGQPAKKKQRLCTPRDFEPPAEADDDEDEVVATEAPAKGKRKAETDEQKEARNKSDRERRARNKAAGIQGPKQKRTLTEAQREAKRKNDKSRKAAWTPEQREASNKARREWEQKRKKARTPEQREAERQAKRKGEQERKAKRKGEQERKAKRKGEQERKKAQTPEQREATNKSRQEQEQKRRKMRTPEQREAENKARREYEQKIRNAQTPEQREAQNEKRRLRGDLRSHVELVDLAIWSWHILHPRDPALDDTQPDEYGGYYWFWHKEQLIAALKSRGIPSRGPVDEMRRFLQLEDALNGLLPRPTPSSASKFHAMSSVNLMAEAERLGYWKGKNRATDQYGQDKEGEGARPDRKSRTSEDLIAFLLNKAGPASQLEKIMQDEQLGDEESDESSQESFEADTAVTRQSFNGGVVGSRAALGSLADTVWRHNFPQWTSSVGLLCGPNALAISIQHQLLTLGLGLHRFTGHELMRMIIPEYGLPGSTLENGDVTHDHLSEEFIAWFNEEHADKFSQDEEGADEALGQQLSEVTRVADLDYQQLVAILEVAFRNGRLPVRLGLGVESAYVDEDGELHPALARIMWQPDGNSPIIWIHNNRALSRDEYNHWEGLGEGTGSRFETAFEWGLLVPDAAALVKARQSWRNDAMQSITDRVRSIADRHRNGLSKRLNKLRKFCTPCRDGDRQQCKQVQDQEHCENCADDPDDCDMPEDTMKLNWKAASELTAEDQRLREKVLASEEELEMYRLARTYKPTLRPEGEHWLILGSARYSNGPGDPTIAQQVQTVINSVHQYVNVANNPQDHGSPQVAGHLAGLPTQRYYQVISRHGTRPVPTQLGNLDDPVLRGFVRFIHQLLDPNNVNNLPVEIHFVMFGLAGFSVGIEGWGDRTRGFFKMLLDADQANGTNVADSVYLVFLAEPHVVDGIAPHCLDLEDAVNYPRPVGPPSPYWYRPHHPDRNKPLEKVRLRDVVDRAQQLRAQGHQNQVTGINNPPPPYPVPNVNVDQLDRLIRDMQSEYEWRSGQLAPQGGPGQVSSQVVGSRNVNRNDEFR